MASEPHHEGSLRHHMHIAGHLLQVFRFDAHTTAPWWYYRLIALCIAHITRNAIQSYYLVYKL